MGSGCKECENLPFPSEKFENGRFEEGSQICSKGGKRTRFWKKVKYQLVEYHSLPEYLRDNEFILGHYRSEWPLKQVLLSIFSIHNETLNVWTHLIGFFLFLSLTIYTAMKVPKVVDLQSLPHLPDVLRKADLHELLTCLPSMPNMPDLQKLRDEFKTSLPSMDMLPSLSGWHIPELLANCLPERFSHSNHTDPCVLHEGGCGKYDSTLDGKTNHTVAILCFYGWSHVLSISQQHLPSSLLPL
uniref:Heptahelical transmembrane protein 4-like n=1 Tax=Nelumbo nucifera TaxID=4432 RepID=A0A822ZDJ7_NELNU|nr:TPA_asm: hypothetical protein HUJ06_015862 [Nelumbo nucifera]